jgi:hypothetical protein
VRVRVLAGSPMSVIPAKAGTQRLTLYLLH